MARRESFSVYLKTAERDKLMILARGSEETASAWLIRQVNERWRAIWGEAAPHEVAGHCAAEPVRRVRGADGKRRRVAA